jgi:hypothetical protein
MVKVKKSLAGTGNDYVLAQVAVRDDQLNIQVAGPAGNRSYGYAARVSAEKKLIEYVQNLNGQLPSLSGSEKADYAECQLRVKNVNKIHMQIPGPNLNRPYGAAADFYHPGLAEWLEIALDEWYAYSPDAPKQ